ncbi:mannosyltransferase family protein [Streptomyces sp. NPDC048638]|uniref:mannosyltransferase family protein n=1 Tax=Streptomyces sp. NPDC048638 TaxID=3365580 RepID=UPI003714D2DF
MPAISPLSPRQSECSARPAQSSAAPARPSPPPRTGGVVRPPRSPADPPRARTALLGLRAFRLGPADREVLWLYLLSRTAVWVTAYCTRWLFPADRNTRTAASVLAPFEQWDWGHYVHIARDGYFPGQAGPWQAGWDNREAFFPGFPLLLRAVHVVVPHWVTAGLLISFVSGAIAVLALARITRRHLPDAHAGRRTVLFFLLSPCAIFLAAGYTEALFLALALPAWLAARRRNWPLAAALTALAITVRVSGLFLAAAIALHFVLAARNRSEWRSLPWLALPAVPVALYTCYLYAYTGDWMAWKHAEERGWYRTFHAPWEAWQNTWHAAFAHTQTTGYAFMFQAELVAMLVGLLLLGLLIRQRRWPEALYLGLSLWALGTSYWYTSIPRATLLWWPLWISLAAWSMRHPRFTTVYLSLVGPLTAVYALAFLSGRWAG